MQFLGRNVISRAVTLIVVFGLLNAICAYSLHSGRKQRLIKSTKILWKTSFRPYKCCSFSRKISSCLATHGHIYTCTLQFLWNIIISQAILPNLWTSREVNFSIFKDLSKFLYLRQMDLTHSARVEFVLFDFLCNQC